jgi:hypothetical protein
MVADTGLATCAGHLPSGGRSFRKQRTVNPLIVPARYNFLYASSRTAAPDPWSVVAEELGSSLRWATATPVKATRNADE